MPNFNFNHAELSTHSTQRLMRERGRVISFPPSVSDPSSGGFYVECAKHLKMIRVKNLVLLSIESAIENAFWECPDCVNEREAVGTRWPEGAEL
jgi:hypothetical protein